MDLNVSQFLSPGRKEFVKGTLLLTGAGLFCRILGFFYRIYTVSYTHLDVYKRQLLLFQSVLTMDWKPGKEAGTASGYQY